VLWKVVPPNECCQFVFCAKRTASLLMNTLINGIQVTIAQSVHNGFKTHSLTHSGAGYSLKSQ